MSIHVPPADWFKGPTGFERTWVGVALAWCVVMFAVMPYWHFRGKQNSTGESYSVSVRDFVERAERFAAASKVGERDGVPIVEPPPDGHAYLVARQWSFYPILRLKRGERYRLHVSSTDVQHGFALLPMNMNFQILPGYDHVLTIRPTTAGDFRIICNEFCGADHHKMVGRIIVE